MNKKELIQAIMNKTGYPRISIHSMLDGFIDVVTEQLAKQESVQLVGLGSFETANRAARTGHNLRTGEAVDIPASVAPKFRAGKALKEAIPQPKAAKVRKAKTK